MEKNHNELIDASVVWIANAIRTKQVSSEEVVRAFLNRIEQVNPEINAVVQLLNDSAIAGARAADNELHAGQLRGPLHGVPFTVKDSFDTAGVISTAGLKGRASFVPETDATAVARVRAAGAIMLGFLSHLVLDELCSVDFNGMKIRLNRYAGSALKFWSKSVSATLFTYALLGGLVYLTWP